MIRLVKRWLGSSAFTPWLKIPRFPVRRVMAVASFMLPLSKGKGVPPIAVVNVGTIRASVLAALVALMTAETALAQSFVWPVDVHPIGQAYANYGAVVAGMYHAGMDMGYEGTYDYSKTVKAVRAGVVHKVFGLSTGLSPSNLSSSSNVRRWNPSTGVYSWDGQPTTDRLGQAYGTANHGLGMCVIIYHSDLQLYTLYGHMDAIVAGLTPGQSVSAGTPIGRMGDSYQQYLRRGDTRDPLPPTPSGPLPSGAALWSSLVVTDATGFRPHVHFETKDRGVISVGRTDSPAAATEQHWGYTPGTSPGLVEKPGHPNFWGYHDPDIFLNLTVTKLSQPVPIEVLGGLNVRDYPSTSSSLSLVITEIAARGDGRLPGFVASRSVGGEWYQIFLPNATTEGWSASGWIAGNLSGTVYSRANNALPQVKITPESARIYASANTSSATLGFAYGQNLIEEQRFVPFESPSGWHRVYIPQKASQPDGWLLASAVTYIPGSTPSDTIPNAFNFTSQTGVALNTTVTSTPSITVSGINAAAPISVTGGSYSVNGGAFTTVSGTVNNGNTVALRLTSSGSYSTQTCATLNIGGVQGLFCATTQAAPAVDTIPNAFSFTSQTGVALNTAVTSTPSITVSGINAAAPISVTGGSYSVNGSAFTTVSGTVNNGNTVALRLTSSGSYSTQTCATLNIGGVQGLFCATTQAAPAVDTIPNAFSFTSQTGVALNTAVTSTPSITVSGINAAAPISVTGGNYSINGGAFTAVSGTVNNGNTVAVRLTSSGSYSTPTCATLNIGGVSGQFCATTQAPAVDTTPNAFSFTSQTGVALNTTVTSTPSITVSGINAAALIGVSGGTYNINGGAFTTAAGTVNNGNTVAVRLTSSGSYSTPTCATLNVGGVQGSFCATTQAAPVATNTKASITSPTPGSKLAGASVTFAWNAGSGVSQYWFYVGTSAGGLDLYGQSQGTNRSLTLSGLPTDGRNLYVRLWSLISGIWQFNDYMYTAAGTAVTNPKASITSPTPGSKLAGASVTFAWNAGSGVSQYWFYVGTSAGGLDLYGQSQGTNRSLTVSGLPTDGRNLYVRLWSFISGIWQFNDYTYTATGIKLVVFPIPNRTHSTVSINSVFDHSMTNPYCSDNVVVAYTGEEGRSSYGSKLVGNITGCGNLYSFKNVNGTVFSVGGQFTGAGTPEFLSYDGHPGYDYRTTDQCPGDGRVTTDCPTGLLGQTRIRAAAAGRVSTIVPSYGRVQIDHGDGYETWYMHLSKIDVTVGQSVVAGDYIGNSGDTGSTGSPHLHFEVRLNGIPLDPYGWQGSGVDPYALDENIWLW